MHEEKDSREEIHPNDFRIPLLFKSFLNYDESSILLAIIKRQPLRRLLPANRTRTKFFDQFDDLINLSDELNCRISFSVREEHRFYQYE